MGNYLKTDEAKYIATHLESIEKSRSGRGIYLCFDTVKNGEMAYGILLRVFPNHDHSTGIDKRDFHILFPSRSERDEAFDGLTSEIAGYAASNDHGSGYGSDEFFEGSGSSETTGKSGWVTYLIIGVVAVIIFLLLWNKKKK